MHACMHLAAYMYVERIRFKVYLKKPGGSLNPLHCTSYLWFHKAGFKKTSLFVSALSSTLPLGESSQYMHNQFESLVGHSNCINACQFFVVLPNICVCSLWLGWPQVSCGLGPVQAQQMNAQKYTDMYMYVGTCT